MRTIIPTTLLASSLALAGASDSLALSRWRADSALAVGLLQQAAKADSTAQVQRIQARTVWELALRNLQRDTTKTK